MSLKRTDIDILKYIINSPAPLVELSEVFETSQRNIRYILDNLNFYLLKILGKEIEKINKKFTLTLSEKELSIFLNYIYKNDYVLTQEERMEYTLLLFLFIKNVKLTFIEEKLKITRATVKNDMEQLSEELKKYSLFFSFNKNKFSISGNEKKLRHLMTIKFLKYFYIAESYKNSNLEVSLHPKNSNNNNNNGDKSLLWLDYDIFHEFLQDKKINQIWRAISKIENSFYIEFPKEFKELILVFLLVSHHRISENSIITKKTNFDFLINTPYFLIVKKHLRNIIPQTLSYELAHLTEYFISGGVTENISELDTTIDEFIDKLLLYINKKLDTNIGADDLKNQLKFYLIPAVYRLRNNFTLGTMGKKSEIYFLVEEFCLKDSILPEKLTTNEIYFISTLLDLSLEKNSKKLIDLNKLIEIVENNCVSLNHDSFISDLMKNYSNVIKK